LAEFLFILACCISPKSLSHSDQRVVAKVSMCHPYSPSSS